MLTWRVLSLPPVALLTVPRVRYGLTPLKFPSYSHPKAARIHSSGTTVAAVVPDDREVSVPVLLAVLSVRGDATTRPGTRSALAARSGTDGWVMVMVPFESACVTGADSTTVRTPSPAEVVGLLATSLSTVYV